MNVVSSTTPTVYLNENIAVQLVPLLRDHQVLSVHTLIAGNQGVSDERQLEYAHQNGYVLITHNRKHFKKFHKKWLELGKSHPGIIVMKCQEPEILAKRIKKFLEDVYPQLNGSFCLSPPEF